MYSSSSDSIVQDVIDILVRVNTTLTKIAQVKVFLHRKVQAFDSGCSFMYVVFDMNDFVLRKYNHSVSYSLEHRYTSRRSAQDVVNSHDVGIYYTATTCKRETFGVSE